MNISKALKVKNRLVGEVNRLRVILSRENSRRNDNVSTVDREQLFSELEHAFGSLVKLKGAIGVATGPISEKLANLAEKKAHLNWINSLPTREGPEQVNNGLGKDPTIYTWTAFVPRAEVDDNVKETQGEINEIQDEIDEYNARTKVDFEE